MSSSRIATRYAKSLLGQAIELGKVDEVREDMATLESLCGHREFELLLKSPIIDSKKKKSIFQKILQGKIQTVTEKFAEIIFNKGREAALPHITKAFAEQYNELKQKSKVDIISAVKIDDSQLEKIKAKIIESKATHPNVELTTHVDEDLIGGFILRVGDKDYDASVRGKLDGLKKKLNG